MPKKIKIALTIVAIVAVFSVYQLAQYVHAVANKNSTFQEGTPLPDDVISCPTCDPDHDGLTNAEEIMWGTDPFNPDTDGDGFKDGEEVKSGHNPLVPGPNDLINDANLTNQFSNLLVSGLYSGDLQPDSKNYNQAVADITNSITDSSKYVFGKTEDASSFQTIPANAESRASYLRQVGPVLEQFQSSLADEYKNSISNLNAIGDKGYTDAIKAYFSGQANTDQGILDKGNAILVPKDFSGPHTQFLNLVQQLRDINTDVASGDKDPIKASVALNSLFSIYDGYVGVIRSYQKEMVAQHLDPSLLNQ